MTMRPTNDTLQLHYRVDETNTIDLGNVLSQETDNSQLKEEWY